MRRSFTGGCLRLRWPLLFTVFLVLEINERRSSRHASRVLSPVVAGKCASSARQAVPRAQDPARFLDTRSSTKPNDGTSISAQLQLQTEVHFLACLSYTYNEQRVKVVVVFPTIPFVERLPESTKDQTVFVLCSCAHHRMHYLSFTRE